MNQPFSSLNQETVSAKDEDMKSPVDTPSETPALAADTPLSPPATVLTPRLKSTPSACLWQVHWLNDAGLDLCRPPSAQSFGDTFRKRELHWKFTQQSTAEGSSAEYNFLPTDNKDTISQNANLNSPAVQIHGFQLPESIEPVAAPTHYQHPPHPDPPHIMQNTSNPTNMMLSPAVISANLAKSPSSLLSASIQSAGWPSPHSSQSRSSLLSSSFKTHQQTDKHDSNFNRRASSSSQPGMVIDTNQVAPYDEKGAVSIQSPPLSSESVSHRTSNGIFGLSPIHNHGLPTLPLSESVMGLKDSSHGLPVTSGQSASTSTQELDHAHPSLVSRVPSLTGDEDSLMMGGTPALFKAPTAPSNTADSPSMSAKKIHPHTLQTRLSQRRHTATAGRSISRESLKQLITQQQQPFHHSKSSCPSSPLISHAVYGQSVPVTASSYSSFAPSPAVSFLSSIAEATNPQALRSPQVTGWDGEQVGPYWIGKRLGVGNFAEVYTAYLSTEGDSLADAPALAVKVMSKTRVTVCDSIVAHRRSSHLNTADEDENLNPQKQEELSVLKTRISREVEIWRQLHHPHIAPLLDSVETDKHLFLFTEYYRDGNLLEYINLVGRDGLSEQLAAHLFHQMTEAVYYLHTEINVVHRDLKPENMLLSADKKGNLVLKICDFGLCEYFRDSEGLGRTPPSDENEVSLCAGSLAYCSPEELDPTLLTQLPKCIQSSLNAHNFLPTLPNPSSDVWSLAVVLYAILIGRLPFADDYMPRLQLQIVAGRYKPLPAEEDTGSFSSMNPSNQTNSKRFFSKEVRDLVDKMLQIRVWDRLNIQQVRDHAWLKPFHA